MSLQKTPHTQFTTNVHKGKRENTQWGDLGTGCTSTTGTHKVLDCQKHIGRENSTSNCLYCSSSSFSTLYCIHLSVYLFIHPSVHPTPYPSFFPIFPDSEVHRCVIETHAAEHHFWFYDTGFERESEDRKYRNTEQQSALWIVLTFMKKKRIYEFKFWFHDGTPFECFNLSGVSVYALRNCLQIANKKLFSRLYFRKALTIVAFCPSFSLF